MTVGTVYIRLVMRESHSLKDKRSIVKSLKDTLASRFNISVSEVDHLNEWQQAGIGVAAVGTDGKFVGTVLNSVVQFVRLYPRAEMIEHVQEVFEA